MADLMDAALPVKGFTAADLPVSIHNYDGATFNPATQELQENILEGITGSQETLASILDGVTALEDINGNILAGVTALEESNLAILDGVTGLQEINGDILNGVTTLQETSLLILGGVTALEESNLAILDGVTGISAQLPSSLGATTSAQSLSVAMATDQPSIPVYITAGAANTPVVDYTTGVGVAYLAGITGSYSPTNDMVLDRVWASATARLKVEVYVGPTAAPVLKWVGFNSTANPNVSIDCSGYKLSGSTDKVQVVVTNYEKNVAQDLYCTIMGDEE